MPLNKYIIERDIPEVGSLDREQLAAAAKKSDAALAQLAPAAQWVASSVAANKRISVNLGKNEDVMRTHCEISGFPPRRITPIREMIDPTTERGA